MNVKEVTVVAAPRLFVSYSWTSEQHAEWVIQLATELRESGVDVVLDKWDLKEGHDAHAFMESMVTDPTIAKVILVCDKLYAEKADGRSGGVGTEAQIISSEIYSKIAQDKFVAVLAERDENGEACLPTYYRSRIYIDLTDPSSYSQNFDQLLRWIYGKPLYQKPELGQMPAHLADGGSTRLPTSSRYKRAIEAIRNGRPYAVPAVTEYFTLLVEHMEELRLDQTDDPFDDAVIASIDAFLPYRNEVIDVVLSLSLYLDNEETRSTVHRFFEMLIPYMSKPTHVSQWRESDFDNFKFVVHELFLYVIAILVRRERFASAAYLLENRYYVSAYRDYGRDPMADFGIFRQYTESLEKRNQRLNLRRLALRADLLKERCKGVPLEFVDLMQADLLVFLRSCIHGQSGFRRWWPETLIFAGNHHGQFEVFARSRSHRYFNQMKVILGVDSRDELVAAINALPPGDLPRWQFESFAPATLVGLEALAAGP